MLHRNCQAELEKEWYSARPSTCTRSHTATGLHPSVRRLTNLLDNNSERKVSARGVVALSTRDYCKAGNVSSSSLGRESVITSTSRRGKDESGNNAKCAKYGDSAGRVGVRRSTFHRSRKREKEKQKQKENENEREIIQDETRVLKFYFSRTKYKPRLWKHTVPK